MFIVSSCIICLCDVCIRYTGIHIFMYNHTYVSFIYINVYIYIRMCYRLVYVCECKPTELRGKSKAAGGH